MRPHRRQPNRLLCPWDLPGKNTGVGTISFLQGIILTQGSNPHLLHWHADSLPLSPIKCLKTVNSYTKYRFFTEHSRSVIHQGTSSSFISPIFLFSQTQNLDVTSGFFLLPDFFFLLHLISFHMKVIVFDSSFPWDSTLTTSSWGLTTSVVDCYSSILTTIFLVCLFFFKYLFI